MTDGADASYIVDDICRRLSRRMTFTLPRSRSRCRPTRITNSPANQDRQATLFEAVGNLLSRWHAGGPRWCPSMIFNWLMERRLPTAGAGLVVLSACTRPASSAPGRPL
jgi:hypothetical protein